MTEYVKSTNFTSKDSLASGNPLKIVKGTEFDIEFNNIATAVATKADIISPSLSGIPTAPTAAISNSTSQLATTAFVTSKVADVAPTKTGTGATGTWAIDISGNAATATSTPLVQTTNWQIYESGGVLYFKYGSNIVFKLDSTGNLSVEGNVTAYKVL